MPLRTPFGKKRFMGAEGLADECRTKVDKNSKAACCNVTTLEGE